MKHSHVDVPEHMKHLKMNDTGYFTPWFVEGDDFRIVDGKKAGLAVTKKACWICGLPYEKEEYALVGDPLTAMFRVAKEPPCHLDCATYAMQVCPFILYPNAKRRTAGLPVEKTLEYTNRDRKIKILEDNPGEFYIIVLNDFKYHHNKQVMTFSEKNVIERQYWIGGKRQETHPNPIVPWEKVPESYKRLVKATQMKQKAAKARQQTSR